MLYMQNQGGGEADHTDREGLAREVGAAGPEPPQAGESSRRLKLCFPVRGQGGSWLGPRGISRHTLPQMPRGDGRPEVAGADVLCKVRPAEKAGCEQEQRAGRALGQGRRAGARSVGG